MHPAHSAMVNEMESRFGWPQDERDSDGLILMRLNRMVIRVGKNCQSFLSRDSTGLVEEQHSWNLFAQPKSNIRTLWTRLLMQILSYKIRYPGI